MKIGIFTETYVPQVNGVVTSIVNLSEELERQGHKIYIFAPEIENNNNEKPKFTEFRFKSFQFPFEKNYRIAVPVTVKNAVSMKNLKLDIVYSQNPFGIGGFLGQMFSKIKNIPIVYINHTMYSEYLHYLFGDFTSPKTSVHNLLRIFCNHCDGVIAPSEKIKKYLTEIKVKKPIKVIPSGVKLSGGRYRKSKSFLCKYGAKKGDKIMLYVGRIAKEKNLPFLIKSFKIVKKEVDNVKLVIVGSGNETGNIEKLCSRLKLKNDVIFTGFLSKNDVLNVYGSADIFTFSSLTETQGLVISEAVASGLPVVAIYDEPFEDIVIDGYNGFLTENSEVEFSKKIIYLLKDNAKMNKFSLNSVRLSREKLDIKDQAKETVKFFNYIINKHKI